jgi:hypothetical protein
MTPAKWGEKLPLYQPCPSCDGTGIPPKPVKVYRRRSQCGALYREREARWPHGSPGFFRAPSPKARG